MRQFSFNAYGRIFIITVFLLIHLSFFSHANKNVSFYYYMRIHKAN